MTATIRNLLAGAALVAMAPVAANAITIMADSSQTGAFTTSVNENSSVDFTASEDLRVIGLGVTYNAPAGASSGLSFSINGSPVSFDVTDNLTTEFGVYTDRSGFVVNASETFSFESSSDAEDVGISYSFTTSSNLGNPDVIPLPATGLLLAGALGAAGFVARRKKA